MSILTEKARQLVRAAIGGMLPQDCHLCGTPSGHQFLCPACIADLPCLPARLCPRCAQPLATGEICGRCQTHPPGFDRMIPVFPYAFPIDRLVQQLKYGHRLSLAGWLGEQLARACQGIPADLVVPMPLHPARLAERGFNQAAEIGKLVAQRLALPLDTASCCRTRVTSPQEGLDLEQRKRNLRNAFHCRADLEGKRLLLIDDVATTGASADECARTLKLHGASQVCVAVVARTLLT